MNERIQSLAEEAGYNPEDGGVFKFDDFKLEKFAELIIQECTSLFPLTFTDERYQRRIDKTIRKHFGLE